jgi:hypothetical protein
MIKKPGTDTAFGCWSNAEKVFLLRNKPRKSWGNRTIAGEEAFRIGCGRGSLHLKERNSGGACSQANVDSLWKWKLRAFNSRILGCGK